MTAIDLRAEPPPPTWGVGVSETAIRDLSIRWADSAIPSSGWDYAGLPDWDGPAWLDFCIAAVSVVVCLWPPDGAAQWEVDYGNEVLDDAPALFSRFAVNLTPGHQGLDFGTFRGWSQEDGNEFFKGRGHLQLVPERIERLSQVAEAMESRWGGSGIRLVEAADRHGRGIVELLVATVPGFRDETESSAGLLRFNKLAHLAVAMMAARSPVPIDGLERFPVYPDYMLPVVFRHHRILHYSDDLRRAVDGRYLIGRDSEWEAGIRWATVYAGEYLRRELNNKGNPVDSPALDFYLWSRAVLGPEAGRMGEHHRTVTMAY